ncbi:MAG: DUF348 domain-containing protein [Chloroflexi bacterium]|nr:DUF348 domain-containing protein [Chloroflexota bacterium]
MTTISPSDEAPESQPRRPLRPRKALLVAAGLALALLLSAWQYQDRLTPITIVVDGRAYATRTIARSADEVLERAGFLIFPHDRVLAPQGELEPGARIVVERARPVWVTEGNSAPRAYYTLATTVGEFLAEQNLALGWKDRVWVEGVLVDENMALPAIEWIEPPAGLPRRPWDYRAKPIELRIERAISVVLLDDGAAPAMIRTRGKTVADALAEGEVEIFPGDEVFPPLDAALRPGQRIVIQRATPIQIVVDGETLDIRTREETVAAALAEQGIMLFGLDRVSPRLDTPLQDHTIIRITRVREDVIYEDERIPFQTVWRPDDELLIDERRIAQKGAFGLLRRRYRVRYEDGEEVERALEAEWVAVEPQNKVIAYGRKIIPRTLETPEGTITYWRKIRAYTTSYSPRRSGTPRSAPWYGRTRLGMKLTKGVAAVDPSVINMQQKMYIPGYGIAIAGDTGGGVRGRWVDLGYDDDNYRSWHWWSDVYLLWPPPPSYAIRYVLPNWPTFPDKRR